MRGAAKKTPKSGTHAVARAATGGAKGKALKGLTTEELARRVHRSVESADPAAGRELARRHAALPKEPPDPDLVRLMADMPSALRVAIEQINAATIAAQELETIADEGGAPQDEDFAPLYRALRLARSHVQLVLDDELEDLGAAIGVSPMSEEDEAAAIAVVQAANVEKFGKVA